MNETYSGHVDPGGLAASRIVETATGPVEIRKLSVGPMDNNVYVLIDRNSDEALLIDAANDASRISSELGGLRVHAIMTTHGHYDHWQALSEVTTETGAPVALHPADADLVPVAAQINVADGDKLVFGSHSVELIHTPGHTAGSTCVLLRALEGDHLFTGDTLFPGGPGNTFGNPDAFAQIMQSLRDRLFVLPDETWVYPGHGDDTTIGAERPHLHEWQARGW